MQTLLGKLVKDLTEFVSQINITPRGDIEIRFLDSDKLDSYIAQN